MSNGWLLWLYSHSKLELNYCFPGFASNYFFWELKHYRSFLGDSDYLQAKDIIYLLSFATEILCSLASELMAFLKHTHYLYRWWGQMS